MKKEFGVCDECGHSAPLTRDRKLMVHRHHDGERFTRTRCKGTGGIPVFVWVGKNVHYVVSSAFARVL